jgi:DNA excision repair protein ERCC-2
MDKNPQDKIKINLSVKDLIDITIKTGSLNSGFTSASNYLEGISAHKYIQSKYPDNSKTEIPVSIKVEKENYEITIAGRIDGLLQKDNLYIIEEIKSTSTSVKKINKFQYPLHWAQAKCYSYIFLKENNLKKIEIQITYINRYNKKIKSFTEIFLYADLDIFFNDLLSELLYWENKKLTWIKQRNYSIKNLKFPFSEWRKEQRKLSVGCWNTIVSNKNLFVQAPTGTGKTIGTLFPAIKSIASSLADKIFYLTAKTTTQSIAENTISELRKKGLKIKSIIITAKDKICFEKEASCDAESCQYANDFYFRLNNALIDILNEDSWTKEIIEYYSKKYSICPFEFSLTLSLFADCIICDYNYLFDPFVFLKRFFLYFSGEKYIFLIDEAHNLVDRARNMFSAVLVKSDILKVNRDVKNTIEYKKIKTCLNKINSYLLALRKECVQEKVNYLIVEKPEEILFNLLQNFVDAFEIAVETEKCKSELLLEQYFEIKTFLKIYELYNEKFITYYQTFKNNIIIKLFCLDPSELLKNSIKKGACSIFFSATLSPISYFINILGGDENSLKLTLTSPFKKDNLKIVILNNISTKFKDRQNTIEKITETINDFVSIKKGNYFIFFPSYKYLNNVNNLLKEKNSNLEIVIQNQGMSEEERNIFLNKFSHKNKSTLVGMTIMGGFFGEGIDLIGDRLNGVVIVGVGLPKVCLEKEIIKNYFDKINSQGFKYSYIYPGMIKVMQAVGRIIRTETDTGAALLIDKRFTYHEYMKLFPQEWQPVINSRLKISWQKYLSGNNLFI